MPSLTSRGTNVEFDPASLDAATIGWTKREEKRAQKYLRSHFSRKLIERESGSALIALPSRVLEVVRALRLTNALEVEMHGNDTRDKYLPPIADMIVTSDKEAN